MKDLRLRGVAERLGLREMRCPKCFKGRTPAGTRCPRCEGSGRLWSGDGSPTLPDARLRRLA